MSVLTREDYLSVWSDYDFALAEGDDDHSANMWRALDKHDQALRAQVAELREVLVWRLQGHDDCHHPVCAKAWAVLARHREVG